jgi:hypothetical protein
MQNLSPSPNPFFFLLKKEVAILLVDCFEENAEGTSEPDLTHDYFSCTTVSMGFKARQTFGSLAGLFPSSFQRFC